MTGLFVVGFLISILGIIIYFSRESAIKQVQPDNNDERIVKLRPSEYTETPESVVSAYLSEQKALANSESVDQKKKVKPKPFSPLTTIHSQPHTHHDYTQEYYPVIHQVTSFPATLPSSEPVVPINDWSSWASSSNNASEAATSGASSGFDSSSSSSSSYDSSSSSSYDSGSSSSGGDW